jgi:hypothetical protein
VIRFVDHYHLQEWITDEGYQPQGFSVNVRQKKMFKKINVHSVRDVLSSMFANTGSINVKQHFVNPQKYLDCTDL